MASSRKLPITSTAAKASDTQGFAEAAANAKRIIAIKSFVLQGVSGGGGGRKNPEGVNKTNDAAIIVSKGASQTTKVKHSIINLALATTKVNRDETNVPEEEWMTFEVGDLAHIEPPMQFEAKINRSKGDQRSITKVLSG